MNIEQRIRQIEINIVALRKAADEQMEKLMQLKIEQQKKSTSPVRRNLKQKRMEEIAKNYMTRWKIKGSKITKN